MRGFRLFEKPIGVFATIPPLRVEGALPGYEHGEDYEGRLDIIDSIGKCTVELLDNNLPPGSTVHVDNFNKQVVIRWPAYSPADEEKAGILNWNFEEGDLTGWKDLRGNSWSVEEYSTSMPPQATAPGNRAAWMRGVGRGDHILESILYPVVPGQPVMARSLWDQGPSNKDNNNLWTALQFWTPGKVKFTEAVYGDRIHDRTNKARHWSTVNTSVPSGAGWVTVQLIAHRRNSRNRQIIVDEVETTGLQYAVGVDNGDDFYLTVRVRDSANRVALWSGIIPFRSFFYTSRPYSLILGEALAVSSDVSNLTIKVGIRDGDTVSSASVSTGITGFVIRLPVTDHEPSDPIAIASALSSFNIKTTLIPATAVDPIAIASALSSFNIKTHPATSAETPAAVSTAITGFSIT